MRVGSHDVDEFFGSLKIIQDGDSLLGDTVTSSRRARPLKPIYGLEWLLMGYKGFFWESRD